QQILSSIFSPLAGGTGFWADFANAVIGKKASGGSISAGRPYVVGERGPELIVPANSGAVIPNHRLGGGMGVNVTVNQDNRNAMSPAQIMEFGERLRGQILNDVMRMNSGYAPV